MKRLVMVLAAMLIVTVALSDFSAQAAESCIVSDPKGRIAHGDLPLTDKSGFDESELALKIVYAWAIDWSSTESADWPALNAGLIFVLR